MFETKPDPVNFSYGGALYVKDEKGCVRFTGHSSGATDEYGQVSLSDAVIDSGSVKGTPLWNLIYEPDYDITAIRVSRSVVKIKRYFLRENDHCAVFLFRDKVFIRITITNSDIAEYESLPPRMIEKEDATAIAWLYSNKQNNELYHKRVREGSLC